MSVEYVIDNHITKQSLYCTRAFGNIEINHLIGSLETIEQNLKQQLYLKSEYTSYNIKYCKYAANIIANFIGNATIDDIDIHDDSWFRCDYKMIYAELYVQEQELDKWIAQHNN